MREIKFRGFSKKHQQWLTGNYILNRGAHFIAPVDEPADGKTWEDYEVDPDTVGQYTGLTDKNGREIYEGDVVECVSWNEYFSDGNGNTMEPFRRKMHVEYMNGGFKMVEPMPEPMKDNAWDIICNGDIIIIGNIHDNPELLKRNEQ